MSKEQNQKKLETDKARSLSHSALGYQSPLEPSLADIGVEFNSFNSSLSAQSAFKQQLLSKII